MPQRVRDQTLSVLRSGAHPAVICLERVTDVPRITQALKQRVDQLVWVMPSVRQGWAPCGGDTSAARLPSCWRRMEMGMESI
jgi:hypothetical protein